MADYISSLTGVAMDSALLDMAEHTSEAYAVGERNGVPVDSSDVTYHNNARYYAQQAQSIAPASVTEAVRWDVAQTALTDAQREQARENIKATSYNYNLLDNGWFLLNSRGQSSYSSAGYTFDRWKVNGGAATYTKLSPYGITVTCSGDYAYDQYVNTNKAYLLGKTVTASVNVGGTIYSGSGIVSAESYFITVNAGIVKLRVGLFASSNANYPFIRISGNSPYGSADIYAVKLELGSFSTLAYDTPPDYGEELTRCIYSTADPTDTYANNGFGRTNPNLLDNPWFGSNEVVNQRGATSGSTTHNAYSIDRWKMSYGNALGTWSIGANGLTISAASGTYALFDQVLPTSLTSYISGKTLTASCLMSDGSIYSGTVVWTSGTSETFFTTASNFRLQLLNTNAFRMVCNSGASNTVRAVKLELGSVSTLANDTLPKEDQATADCKWYFQRIQQEDGYTAPVGFGIVAASTTILRTLIPLSSPLRKAGSLTATATNIGQMRVQGNGSNLTPTAITGRGVLNGNAIVDITVNGTLANNQFYTLVFANSTAIIDLSKDL